MSMETARKRITYAMHNSYSLMTEHTATTHETHRGWDFRTALQLGRVSNLPTVWTNTLTAIVLSGASTSFPNTMLLVWAMSLAYTGGMYLNDAFDREIDALERPGRPIPSNKVTAREVFIAGFAMLGMAILLVGLVASHLDNALPALTSCIALCVSIVGYNVWHKGNPSSPILMGICRSLVYVTTALAISPEPNIGVYVGACIMLAYLIGLTYTAKQEQFGHVSTLWPLVFLAAPLLYGAYNANGSWVVWTTVALASTWIAFCLTLILRRKNGDIPRAVVNLIAGISLVDALLVATAAVTFAAALSVTMLILLPLLFGAFALTLLLQRYISGT